jgi:hypothetical protein
MRGTFKSENPKERNWPEDLVVDGKILLKYFLNKWVRVLNCINVTQDRNEWSMLVKTAMNLRVA